jgi:Flp pilus assembly protein TadB
MASAPRDLERPAFYALRSGGWRDLVTLLHPPYTAWHLSYVAIGAAAAPHIYANRLLAALAAFFLAVGISAHALDELHGRPLGTRLSRTTLIALAGTSLLGAVAIGIAGVIVVSPLIAPLVVAGALLVPAYNLELLGGRFHNDTWFAVAWGGFPAFTGYFANALMIRPAGVLVAAACCLLSAAQRHLSTPVRRLRRSTTEVTGQQHLRDGSTVELTRAGLADPLERALRALSLAVVLLAVGLVAIRL